MKTTLGILTEEGRTRLKNAIRRSCVYAMAMIVLAGVGGYAIYRYWVSANLTTLQRVYFNQYLTSSYRSYLPNSISRYTTLFRLVTDAETKTNISLAVCDEQIRPLLEGIEHKQYLLEPITTFDKQVYEWFRHDIYGGKRNSVFSMLSHGEKKADLDRFGTPTAGRLDTLGRIRQ